MTSTTTPRHTTNIALSFALALAAFMTAQTAHACMPPPVDRQYSGDFGFAPPGLYVATTQEEWEALWTLSGLQDDMPGFSEGDQTAVGIFLGPRNTSGFNIEVRGLNWTDEDGVAQLDYVVYEPEGMAAQVLTTPFAIAILNRTAPSIVDEAGNVIDTPPILLKTNDES